MVRLSSILLLAFVLVGCSNVTSQEEGIRLAWQLPTMYEDGSPLSPAELEATIIRYGETAGGPYTGTHTVPAPATQTTLTGALPGGCGTVYMVAVARATNGLESGPSNEVSFTEPCRPNPPSNLEVLP